MNKEVVKELIQDDLTVENIVAELKMLLFNNKKREALQKDYTALKELLTAGGHASNTAARSIYTMLNP